MKSRRLTKAANMPSAKSASKSVSSGTMSTLVMRGSLGLACAVGYAPFRYGLAAACAEIKNYEFEERLTLRGWIVSPRRSMAKSSVIFAARFSAVFAW